LFKVQGRISLLGCFVLVSISPVANPGQPEAIYCLVHRRIDPSLANRGMLFVHRPRFALSVWGFFVLRTFVSSPVVALVDATTKNSENRRFA
jgi:hypothetical protein